MIIAAVITIAVFIAAALIGAHFIFPESNGNHSTEISSGKENTSAGKSGKSEEGSVASEERSAESEEGPVADEAGTYFSSDKERQAKGTTWAYNNGLALISPETGDYSSVVFNGAYGYIADYNCMYWLRTPGADNGAAAFVDEKGTVQPGGSYAYYYPNADPKVASPLPELGVRPVLWLNADTAETDASNASEYEISAEERAIAEAYREVVKNYSNGEADTPQYDFGFIDNDNIPELLIAGGNSDAAGVEIYTCKDGAAQRTGVFGQDGNMRYLPYEDTIFTHQADMGCSLNTWYHLDGSIIHTLRNTIEGQEPDPVNEVDDTAVSKEEYESLADQIHTAYPYEQMTMCGKDTNMYEKHCFAARRMGGMQKVI